MDGCMHAWIDGLTEDPGKVKEIFSPGRSMNL
jgi:hypothetical protein